MTERPPIGTSVITVGTFDGVHRGHWRVIQTLVDEAARRRAQSVLVTFEPHPLRVVRPEAAPLLLTTPAEKLEMLAHFGIDRVIVLRFERTLAAYAPRQFVEDILIARLGLGHLVIGYDHGFGRDRSGDAGTLTQIGRELGFDVQVVPPSEQDGTPISSTRIRRALQDGDVAAAAAALGRAYSVRGSVERGEGRGRQLGFPTANLRLDSIDKLLPADGVYAVRTHVHGHRRDALLHIGPRPTFDSAARTVELHVLDFEGDLYGELLVVQLCARLRGIERFDSADALILAMRQDRAAGIALFEAGGGACPHG